jgi:aryl-alcohol dehydrogenase-like predicted oxidoreductase
MIETIRLADDYLIPRIIVGGWQLSAGHSPNRVSQDELFQGLARYADMGLSTFDCADIYGGVEVLLGEFREWYRQKRGAEAAGQIRVHTKFVPDRDELPRISREYVQGIIDRSLRRLQVERVDLVQFHWWDLAIPGFIEAATWLEELRRAGKIRLLGITNFDSAGLSELLAAGVKVASHQVQYSLLDRRAEKSMVTLCQDSGVKLLCYGTVAGGLLSQRYLASEAADYVPSNRSLIKYRLIVDEFGGWGALQELLAVLDDVARSHGVGIANIATRWVLDQPQVAAAIVGARDASHLDENLKAFALKLSPTDRQKIAEVIARHTGPAGDVYQLEREAGGKHASIMRYNLNREG